MKTFMTTLWKLVQTESFAIIVCSIMIAFLSILCALILHGQRNIEQQNHRIETRLSAIEGTIFNRSSK